EVRQLLHLMIHSLYSNKEIFLRELVSNASDAADKLRFEALASPDLLDGDPDLGITVEFDPDNGTISVTDNGIGMSRDEVIENLGTIARSGTAEFLKQMTGDSGKDASLIGQFGVGFYSAFIVADKVVVETRRAGLTASDGVRWESDGQGEFTIEDIDRVERGTRVTLHLKPEEKDDSGELRQSTHVMKYSAHSGFPVTLRKAGASCDEVTTVISATARCTPTRSEESEEGYKQHYKLLAHDFADTLAWCPNHVD